MTKNSSIFTEDFKIRHLLIGAALVGLAAYTIITIMALLPFLIDGPLQ